jgi:UDP-glucose 4-epimerase
MRFIVTGGLGYIGAHTVIQLYQAGHTAIILDDCRNSDIKTLHKLETIVQQPIPFLNIDITNKTALLETKLPRTDFIIHFAALKNVGESTEIPFDYYHNNLVGLLNMLTLAKEINCPNFIFSSSCTVYPHDAPRPLTEEVRAEASNKMFETIVTGSSPYGTTKLMCEQILHDISEADKFWNITILRYFNPVGNHKSNLIGDNFAVSKKSMNLFTAILNKTLNKQPVHIFGNTYNTKDGTCVRDYIHVLDVADAHIAAADNLNKDLKVFNIGTGQGYSVLEIVDKFNELGLKVEYEIIEARKGDVAEVWADCTKAKNILKWEPKYSFEDMVQSTIYYYLHQLEDDFSLRKDTK